MINFKRAPFPQEIIRMGLRWYVAYVRRESGMYKCGNTIGEGVSELLICYALLTAMLLSAEDRLYATAYV